MRFRVLPVVLALGCATLTGEASGACLEPEVVTIAAPGVGLISPAGTAPSLADRGITIYVQVMDCTSTPVPNYPYQDIYLDDDGSLSVVLCQGGSVADANTDDQGNTTISGVISGGGFTGTGTRVYLSGIPVGQSLPVLLNSPDLTADLVVDIADFSGFGLDFGTTALRSDLVYDGTVDIGDFARFGLHFGESCP